MAFSRRGQRYEIIDERAHIRRDDVGTTVFRLRTNCKACGDVFIATCGPRDLQEPTRYLTRRCPSCRQKRKWTPPRAHVKCPHCGQRMPEVGN